MKKWITITFVAFFVTALSAQIPNGTYLPCSDIAKSMYIEKVVFNTNKVKIYLGTMGITMGFEEFDYEVQEMNKELPFVQVYFEYDKTNDVLIFGEAYANSMLGDMLSQLGNSAKLMYNKNGNCNPDLVSNNKVRILVKDNNQDVSAEIINNYLIVPDKNNLIPRLDKEKALKSKKYTVEEIAKATRILHNEIDIQLRGILNKIKAAKLILSFIGNNSADIIDGIREIQSLFTRFTNPKNYIEGKVIDWILERSGTSIGKIVSPNISQDVNSLSTILDALGKEIETLIIQNDTINKE